MKAKKISAVLLASAMMASCVVPAQAVMAEETQGSAPKYVFLFIGDGMSYPQIQTTNYYLSAAADDGDEILTSQSNLNMMQFPVKSVFFVFTHEIAAFWENHMLFWENPGIFGYHRKKYLE